MVTAAILAGGRATRFGGRDKSTLLVEGQTIFDRQLAELKAFAPQPEIKATYAKLEDVWSDYKAALVGSKPDKAKAESVLDLAGKVLALAHQGTVLF